MEIEVCVSSIEDVIRATKGGATRIELCTAMEVLGTTPTISNYTIAKEITDLPILAYIRPRAGGFIYSDLEYEVMVRDALNFYQHGARDFVFGILTPQRKVDKERCKALMNRLGEGCTFTFHKAFDYVKDFEDGVEDLIEIGFTRILTSGGPSSTLDNLNTLQHLISKYSDKIEIMPGGGITENNIQEVLDTLPIKSLHLSAKEIIKDDIDYIATDSNHLHKVVSIINSSAKK